MGQGTATKHDSRLLIWGWGGLIAVAIGLIGTYLLYKLWALIDYLFSLIVTSTIASAQFEFWGRFVYLGIILAVLIVAVIRSDKRVLESLRRGVGGWPAVAQASGEVSALSLIMVLLNYPPVLHKELYDAYSSEYILFELVAVFLIVGLCYLLSKRFSHAEAEKSS